MRQIERPIRGSGLVQLRESVGKVLNGDYLMKHAAMLLSSEEADCLSTHRM